MPAKTSAERWGENSARARFGAKPRAAWPIRARRARLVVARARAGARARKKPRNRPREARFPADCPKKKYFLRGRKRAFSATRRRTHGGDGTRARIFAFSARFCEKRKNGPETRENARARTGARACAPCAPTRRVARTVLHFRKTPKKGARTHVYVCTRLPPPRLVVGGRFCVVLAVFNP